MMLGVRNGNEFKQLYDSAPYQEPVSDMRIVVLRIFVLLFLSFSAPIIYAFDVASWPYEGMPFFRVLTSTLILHKEPSSGSQLAEPVSITKGTVVTFKWGVEELSRKIRTSPDFYKNLFGLENESSINRKIILGKSVQRNISPGIYRAETDGKVDGCSYGKVTNLIDSQIECTEKSFNFKKGAVIEDLFYLGEGVCLFRLAGEVFEEHGCLFSSIGKGAVVEESKGVSEWWVSFEQGERVLGWLNVDENTHQIKMLDTIK